MRRFVSIFFLAGAAMAMPLLAADAKPSQPSNPSLTATINGVNDASARSNALKISTLDMAITLRGSIAETVITATFSNPSNQSLEGNFTLDMPAGSIVTGYALDIAGAMVDGVLVPPHQAQVAYEQRVTRRVDPGIVEVTRGAQFSSRVFPIFPGSGRTIRLKYVTPLDPSKGYQLPLTTAGKIGRFGLSVTSSGSAVGPAITVPASLKPVPSDGGKTQTYTAKDIALFGDITLMPSQPSAPILFSEHRGEGRFFEIADSVISKPMSTKATGTITIMWDRSVSRLDDKLDEEIALISRYLDQVKPSAVDLILFDSGASERITLSDRADVIARLKAVRYGGATSFASLSSQPLSGANSCLIFTDGISTLDKPNDFRPACRLFAITSSREADRGFLEARALKTAGAFIDLTQQSPDESLARLTQNVTSVVDVRSGSGAPIDYAILPSTLSGWRIVGEAPASGEIIVTIAGVGSSTIERRYPVTSLASQDFDGPGALWASSRIASAKDEMGPEQTLALARRYSVASPAASFIVLETPEDYAQAGIDPPPSYPKENRARYDVQRQMLAQNRQELERNRLKFVIAGWTEQRRWWEKKFDPNAKQIELPAPLPPQPRPVPVRRRPSANTAAPEAMSSPPPPPPPPQVSMPEPALEVITNASNQQIVVTGARRERGSGAARPEGIQADSVGQESGPAVRASTTIALQPWSSDRPYILAFENAGKAFDTVFLAQEKKHGSLPAFYLDSAEWLFGKGKRAEAARMAAAALELPTRNNNTLAIVAARLLRYGEADRAIWLLEQLVTLEPERPQPRRTLALALINRAKAEKGAAAKASLERALALLTEVIMTPWEGQYDGIERIALMEANGLIPKLRDVGGKITLDPRLITLLDADLRVTVEWNTKATDMDLWVDEPSKERVIYSHNLSARGGKLSRDMTQGFGPEEYLLRRAAPGVYTVRVNTFATDRLNPNGATTVTARLIRNFGRANEQEELVDLEVLPGSSGERLIGRITLAPEGKPR
jgi:hypothetical protein